MNRLGYIGLGFMGTAMSLRLLERGWTLTVWNREPERTGPIVEAGAVSAGSPAEVARKSDIVLMCVLHTEAVENCVFGPEGVASAGRLDGKILIDHSTIDPAATRTMAERLRAETGMRWVDAPISGGPTAASRFPGWSSGVPSRTQVGPSHDTPARGRSVLAA